MTSRERFLNKPMMTFHMQLPIVISPKGFLTVQTFEASYLEVYQIHVSPQLVLVTGPVADRTGRHLVVLTL